METVRQIDVKRANVFSAVIITPPESLKGEMKRADSRYPSTLLMTLSDL